MIPNEVYVYGVDSLADSPSDDAIAAVQFEDHPGREMIKVDATYTLPINPVMFAHMLRALAADRYDPGMGAPLMERYELTDRHRPNNTYLIHWKLDGDEYDVDEAAFITDRALNAVWCAMTALADGLDLEGRDPEGDYDTFD